MIESYIQPFLNEWLGAFLNPQKRIYWLYFLSAITLGFFYLLYTKNCAKLAFQKIFSKNSWWSKSARADYIILFLNSFLLMLFSSKLLTKGAIAFALYYFLADYFEGESFFYGVLENWQVSILFTFVLFIVDDFTKYWLHRWLHTVSFLWPFHRVHHSANALNFFTVFRIHPVEAFLFSFRNALAQGFVVGCFFFLFAEQVSLTMILGANVFSFLFNILGSNLRHSPVALAYPRFLEKYLISPAQHHIHHSKADEHKNKNFGVVFSCWDRWFGSIVYSNKDDLSYGLQGINEDKEHNLAQIYIIPFFTSFKAIKKRFKRV